MASEWKCTFKCICPFFLHSQNKTFVKHMIDSVLITSSTFVIVCIKNNHIK